MAFFLIYVDTTPMRMKGKVQFARIAMSDNNQRLDLGHYRGLRSGKRMTVYTSGGRVFWGRENAALFSLSHPTPVTTDDGVAEIDNPLDEIFVPDTSGAILQEARAHGQFFPAELNEHWIPVRFLDRHSQFGTGWVRQYETFMDARIVGDRRNLQREPCRVVPIYASELAFDIEWNSRGDCGFN